MAIPAIDRQVIFITDLQEITVGHIKEWKYTSITDISLRFKVQKKVTGKFTHWAELPEFKND